MPVESRGIIDHEIWRTALEVKTNDWSGRQEEFHVYFYTSDRSKFPAKLIIRFSNIPLMYYLNYCDDWFNFPRDVPAAKEKIWRIALDRRSGVRLLIHYNGKLVVDRPLSQIMCYYSDWFYHWDELFVKISFHDKTSGLYYIPLSGNLSALV